VREIKLREFQQSGPVELTVTQRDALVELIPTLLIRPVKGSSGTFTLVPQSTVGAVVVDGLAVVIEPKIPIDRVLFLISYCLDPKNWKKSTFQFDEAESLVEAVAVSFAALLERAFHRGLLQGYRSEEDSLATVRGRIRFDEQLRRRNGIAPPVEVVFDEFTEDITENRILKAALNRLRHLRFRSEFASRRLRRFDQTLANVSLVQYPIRSVPEVQYTRLNEHYRPAIELARLILSWFSLELKHGESRGSAFLVDMNVVFERFVHTALREALGLSERQFPLGLNGRDLHLDCAMRVELLPDLSWWSGGRCEFVGDVKYKAVNVAGIKHPDLYQLLAYTVATKLPTGLLIYASGEGEPARHVVTNVGKNLEVMSVNLHGTPSDILSQMQVVADVVSAQNWSNKAAARDLPGSR